MKAIALPNQLKIIVHQAKGLKSAYLGFSLKVGSRLENSNHTGLAHILEHTMYLGTDKHPNYDTYLEELCAQNNAYTSEDLTHYYVKFFPEHLTKISDLEFDRFSQFSINADRFASELKVIHEEFQEEKNTTFGNFWHHILSACFLNQGSWPVLGKSPSHITETTFDDIKEFYETHYLAQASCLTVVADLDEDKLIDTLSKDWMNLPKRSAHINSLDLTKRMNIHQSYTHKRIAQTHIFVAFHIPYVTHQDYFLVQIIQDLCLSQDFSILHDYFVKENSLCLHTSSFITDNIHENLMIWEFKLQNKISHSDFLEALNKFLLLNFAALVSKKNIIARMPIIQLQFAQSCQYKSYLGQQMGQYGIAGYDDFRVHFLENISKVTQNELLRVANQYFSLPFYNSITYNPS